MTGLTSFCLEFSAQAQTEEKARAGGVRCGLCGWPNHGRVWEKCGRIVAYASRISEVTALRPVKPQRNDATAA